MPDHESFRRKIEAAQSIIELIAIQDELRQSWLSGEIELGDLLAQLLKRGRDLRYQKKL